MIGRIVKVLKIGAYGQVVEITDGTAKVYFDADGTIIGYYNIDELERTDAN